MVCCQASTRSSKDKLTDTNNDGTPDAPDQEMILDTTVAEVILSSGQIVDLDKNTFGNFILGSIHGFKFHDFNGNGKFEGDGKLNGDSGDSKTDDDPLADIKLDLYKWLAARISCWSAMSRRPSILGKD